MGLVEIVLAALCLNATCPYDDRNEISSDYEYIPAVSLKKLMMEKLARELKDETLYITTLRNHRLSDVRRENGTLVGIGVAFDLLDILKNKYHFNYTVVLPKNNVWGSQADGVLHMLTTNKANVSAAFLPVVTTYAQKITYSPSMDTGDWMVMMKRPRESATGSGLLAPFTLPVWILILVSLVLIGPVIYLIIYIQAKLCKDENQIFPLPACIWFVYGALLKQGTTLNPITDTSRLLFSTWWIFITILTAFYTANLTAFLTLSKFTLPINEPKDIGAKKSKWLTTKGNALEDTIMLEGSTVPGLGKTLGSPYGYFDLHDDEIMSKYVAKKDMMFIRETPIVDYVMYDDYKRKTKQNIDEDKRCTFVMTKWAVTSFARAFAYTKDFKYQLLFDSTIQYLVESGIIKFKLREELPDTKICPLDLGSKERQLRNSDLVLTYEIVGGGFALSALIFIIELIIRRPKKTKSKEEKSVKKKDLKKSSKHTFQVNINNNFEKFGHLPYVTKFVTPPPAYNTLFNPIKQNDQIKKKHINGREYWVYDSSGGEMKMVPMRTPSALLFQFTN